LRRIEPEDQIGLLRKIATAEGAEITDDALALITRAEGSARDAQSLLDQAIPWRSEPLPIKSAQCWDWQIVDACSICST
jgi:DNA polymerase III gamma/tau subunit